MTKIGKLILPVAGLGMRLRPLTLSTSKNLIPVGGRPLLEYALEEAVPAGIKDVILVVNPEHRAQYEEYLVSARRKYTLLDFHIRVQEKPWGHGHAVLQAADIVGNEPFMARFCDDVIVGGRPVLRMLAQLFEEQGAPVALLVRTPDVTRYGVVEGDKVMGKPDLHCLRRIVEKPKLEEAPSDLAIMGGFALSSETIPRLRKLERSMLRENDALLINHALCDMIADNKPVYGWEFDGKRLDCGTLEGLKAAEAYLKNYQSSVINLQ